MKKVFYLFVLCFSLFVMSGCGKLGIYESDFGCPQGEDGECLPIEDAYQKSLGIGNSGSGKSSSPKGDVVHTNFDPDPVAERNFVMNDVKNFDSTMARYEECLRDNDGKSSKCEKERIAVMEYYSTAEDRGRAKEVHGTNMRERVTKLAAMENMVSGGSNVVPVREPDTVMEVFIMPYQTESGVLVSERVMWVVVKPGNWTWATNIGSTYKSKLGQTN